MKNRVRHWTAVGVAGAAGVAAIDGTMTRVEALNGRHLGRALVRLLAAGAGAFAAEKLDAPAYVSEGLVVGAVLVTALDLAVAAIPARRIEIPPPRHAGVIGAPWGPQPAYALAGTLREVVPATR